MQVNKVVGWAVGLAALFATFFLPFSDLTSGQTAQSETLYSTLRFTSDNFSAILQLGIGQVTLLAAVVLGGAILVASSGALGVYPSKAGAVGVLGLLLLTVGPIFLFPGYNFSLSNFGNGYWALWIFSIANIILGSFRRGTAAGETVPASTPSPVPPAAMP